MNTAPIIPGLNTHEIMDLAKEIGERGAHKMSYIMVRLNGQIADVFSDWVKKTYPDRAEKVLNHIKETHGGSLNDSNWKHRMSGSGNIAKQVKDMVEIATRKHIKSKELEPLDYSSFKRPRMDGQLGMF